RRAGRGSPQKGWGPVRPGGPCADPLVGVCPIGAGLPAPRSPDGVQDDPRRGALKRRRPSTGGGSRIGRPRAFRRVAGALQGNSLSRERTRAMRRINERLGIAIVVACALSGAGAARADAVTDWNAIMQATVAAPPTNPNLQTRWGAIVQLAVFEAVNAIV